MKPRTIQNDHGLLVDASTTPPTCIGYIFDFTGHGAFDPSGKVKVGDHELDRAAIEAHNKLLAQAEWESLIKHGRGVLYYDGRHVSDWAGVHKVPKGYAKVSSQFVPNAWSPCQRVDVWFTVPDDGTHWHGIQRGDNSLLRVKRVKS